VIFVDTNVFMYAVGGEHPLRGPAQQFFLESMNATAARVTSAEVLQELLHAYVPVRRFATLDAALSLVDSVIGTIWPIEAEDVRMARLFADRQSRLGARDLIHLACCRRRNVTSIKTFDSALAAAFTGRTDHRRRS
jgi:predicted nucleic acid-binding protein